MRKLLIFSLLFTLSIVPMTVLGLGYDIPKGDLPRPEAWPSTFYDELNKPTRVHGVSFNQFDSFFYRSTCAELNSTMKHLSQIQDLDLVVVLHVGPGMAKSPWSKNPVSPADWSVNVENNSKINVIPITINIWLSERAPLSELQVPASIEVTNGGEIETFIRKHKSLTKN